MTSISQQQQSFDGAASTIHYDINDDDDGDNARRRCASLLFPESVCPYSLPVRLKRSLLPTYDVDDANFRWRSASVLGLTVCGRLECRQEWCPCVDVRARGVDSSGVASIVIKFYCRASAILDVFWRCTDAERERFANVLGGAPDSYRWMRVSYDDDELSKVESFSSCDDDDATFDDDDDGSLSHLCVDDKIDLLSSIERSCTTFGDADELGRRD